MVASPKLDRRRAASRPQPGDATSREQLLAAAARVFARAGYHGASMSEIAAEARFSKGALYWSFASKEELFFALLDELDEQLRALMTASATAPADRDLRHSDGDPRGAARDRWDRPRRRAFDPAAHRARSGSPVPLRADPLPHRRWHDPPSQGVHMS